MLLIHLMCLILFLVKTCNRVIPDLECCGAPGAIKNGDYILSSTSGKLVAHYTCYHGFKLKGAAAIVCEGHQWSDQPPQCSGEMCSVTPVSPASICVRRLNNPWRPSLRWVSAHMWMFWVLVCLDLYYYLLVLKQKMKCPNSRPCGCDAIRMWIICRWVKVSLSVSIDSFLLRRWNVPVRKWIHIFLRTRAGKWITFPS